MNRDVANLLELLEDKVGGAAWYASGYWAMHVRSSPVTNEYAIPLISSSIFFFKSNVVPWIEVMSLENRLEIIVHSIYDLLDWVGMVCKLNCRQVERLNHTPSNSGSGPYLRFT
jgi:hypothetical protein